MTLRKILVATALSVTTLAAAACSGNSTTSASTTTSSGSGSGSNVTSSIVLNASILTSTAFSPNPVVVRVGDSVTWVNNDTTAHTSVANNGSWSSGNINPGASFRQTFSASGTFAYHCTIHPGMVGTVTVQ